MDDADDLADRYIALWNEPDAERRRAAIAELWTEDGVHLLQPPQEVHANAARPGIGLAATFEARGHAALETRVTSAHDEFIARRGHAFRRREDVERVADAVKFHWEMVSSEGDVVGVGLELLVLAPDTRIRRDYMFIVG